MAMMFKNRTVNSSYQVGSCGKCRDNYLTQAHCLSGKKLKKNQFCRIRFRFFYVRHAFRLIKAAGLAFLHVLVFVVCGLYALNRKRGNKA